MFIGARQSFPTDPLTTLELQKNPLYDVPELNKTADLLILRLWNCEKVGRVVAIWTDVDRVSLLLVLDEKKYLIISFQVEVAGGLIAVQSVSIWLVDRLADSRWDGESYNSSYQYFLFPSFLQWS